MRFFKKCLDKIKIGVYIRIMIGTNRQNKKKGEISYTVWSAADSGGCGSAIRRIKIWAVKIPGASPDIKTKKGQNELENSLSELHLKFWNGCDQNHSFPGYLRAILSKPL